MIYLLTAIGLTPFGSGKVHIYTQTIHRTTQLTTEQHNNKNNRTSQLTARTTQSTRTTQLTTRTMQLTRTRHLAVEQHNKNNTINRRTTHLTTRTTQVTTRTTQVTTRTTQLTTRTIQLTTRTTQLTRTMQLTKTTINNKNNN